MKKKFLKVLSAGAVALAGLSALSLTSCNNQVAKDDGSILVSSFTSSDIKLQSAVNIDTDSIEVTATINPTYATNSQLTWSIKWNDETYNATAVEISNYVTITPSSDTHKCVIKKLKAFDRQIIVTATSVANPNASASVTVDYLNRIKNVTSNISSFNTGSKTFSTDSYAIGNIYDLKKGEYVVGNVASKISDFIVYEGSLGVDLDVKATLRANDLSNANLSIDTTNTIDVTNTTYDLYDYFKDYCSLNSLAESDINGGDDHLFDLDIVLTTTYEGRVIQTYDVSYYIDFSLTIPVTSVSINTDHIVF